MTLNNSAYTRTRFRAKLFNFRAKHQQGFGRNLYQPSGETLNDLRSSLVLRMLGQMYYELFEWCGHGYSSTNTFVSKLPPLVYAMWAIFLLRNTRGGSAQTYGYRVVSASCRLLLCVWCYSLFGKDTLASNNLLAQITPTPSITPRHDLHSRQNVEHT